MQQCSCHKTLVYTGQRRSSGHGAASERGQFRDIEHFYVFTFFRQMRLKDRAKWGPLTIGIGRLIEEGIDQLLG